MTFSRQSINGLLAGLLIVSLHLRGIAAADQSVKLGDDQVNVMQGGITAIPVLENDEIQGYPAGEIQILIETMPLEGIASIDESTQSILYRHGGASREGDKITYSLAHRGKKISEIATVTLNFRQIRAGIRIVSPANNAVIIGDTIVVEYAVTGSDFDHLHVNLGNQHNTIDNPTGQYTFTQVPPGTHTITVDLANGRHQRLPVSSAEHSITVVVKSN